MKKLNVYVSSRVGCVRKNNEDMILAGSGTYRDAEWRGEGIMLSPKDKYCVAVCDGMGGQAAGEVASEDVAVQLRKFMQQIPSGLDAIELMQTLEQWQSDEHDYLIQRGNDDESLRGMGTTLVSLIYYEDKVYWMNCGDSRLYLFRDGKLTQVSRDHNLFNLTHRPEDSHIILNCMGGGCETSYIDIEEITSTHLDGDLYLLCSDGLVDMIPDEMIQDILISGGRARELTEAACDAGGYDNVSVCIVEFI